MVQTLGHLMATIVYYVGNEAVLGGKAIHERGSLPPCLGLRVRCRVCWPGAS